MTEKELHRLRRQDLLQLLLSQSRDVAKLNSDLANLEEETERLRESNERLKDRLDDKDAQIEHLKERLNAKDAQISALRDSCRLDLSGDGTAGISMKDLFDVASVAAEADFSERNIITIPGEVVMGDKYAEYRVDEEAHYPLAGDRDE